MSTQSFELSTALRNLRVVQDRQAAGYEQTLRQLASLVESVELLAKALRRHVEGADR